MQTSRGYYNLDLMVKYELITSSGVIRLTFINGDICLIEQADESAKLIFNQYISKILLPIPTPPVSSTPIPTPPVPLAK